MVWEAIAAAVVGVAMLALVLQPLVTPRPPRVAAPEPVDLEETPKGIALGALREIEFDRATGKLSDDDYTTLKAKYTAEALAALRAEDRAVEVDDLEALIAVRVRAVRSASAAPGQVAPLVVCRSCGPRPEPDAAYCSSCGARLGAPAACASCGATLPPDSRFCAACGRRVAA